MARYLITGLCFQGNKGGPAIALSLVKAIREELPDAEFVFSVPGDKMEWAHEQKAAEKYGFSVIKNLTLKNIIFPFNAFGSSRILYKNWRSSLTQADALIQMSALGFTGPPAGLGTLRSQLGSSRFHDFLMCKITKKKMYAWTQSYGPFSTVAVRLFAKLDFKFQPIIFCRGKECKDEVKKLVRNKKVLSFPDVAVILSYDKKWGAHYIQEKFSIKKERLSSIVTISPSAVMYSRSTKENNHVYNVVKVCEYLLEKNKTIIIVPHTLRKTNKTPYSCDKEVAELILKKVSDTNLYLVKEDLSPMELKSIISNAQYHIGARYHSVVASLSSGVPAISLSWHPKYKDLMGIYGMENFVLDEANGDILKMLEQLFHLDRAKLEEKELHVGKKVRDNASIFCELLRKKV